MMVRLSLLLCIFQEGGGNVFEHYPRSSFGYSVAGIGDCDGDGQEDIAIGMPAAGGQVFIAYSSTGYEARQVLMGVSGERIGRALSATRDCESGKTVAVIVGNGPLNHGPQVSMYMYTPAGALEKLAGDATWGWFKGQVFEMSDVNGDGVSDWCRLQGSLQTFRLFVQDGHTGKVLAKWEASGVRVYSVNVRGLKQGSDMLRAIAIMSRSDRRELLEEVDLATGDVLNSFELPSSAKHMYASSVSWMDDASGDGRADIAVARVGADGAEVRVVAGASGAALWVEDGSDEGIHNLGSSLIVVDDIDNDGVSDLIVGGPSEKGRLAGRGCVVALSGATGSRLWSHEGQPGEFLGRQLAQLQDLNGDGANELVVTGHPWLQGDAVAGSVLVLSGATGEKLLSIKPPLSPEEEK